MPPDAVATPIGVLCYACIVARVSHLPTRHRASELQLDVSADFTLGTAADIARPKPQLRGRRAFAHTLTYIDPASFLFLQKPFTYHLNELHPTSKDCILCPLVSAHHFITASHPLLFVCVLSTFNISSSVISSRLWESWNSFSSKSRRRRIIDQPGLRESAIEVKKVHPSSQWYCFPLRAIVCECVSCGHWKLKY